MRVHVFFHDRCFDGSATAAVFTEFFRQRYDARADFVYTGLAHRASQLFDEALFSADELMMKPDPRIYRRMAELLGVDPEHCTFVGDGAYRELQGAEEVGMTAVLIRVPHDEWEHDGTIGWTGPRVSSLSEVLALV